MSNLNKLLYGLVVAGQVHNFLLNTSSDYNSFWDQVTTDLKKKLGLKKNLWDDMTKFLGTDKPCWSHFHVKHVLQNNLVEASLLDMLQIHQIIRHKTAPKPCDDFRLVHGQAYLSSFDISSYINEALELSVRDFQYKPDSVGRDSYRTGFSADRITFAYFRDHPVILQRGSNETTKPVSLNYLTPNEKIAELFHKELKGKTDASYFQGWVCKYKNGQFEYYDDLCEKTTEELTYPIEAQNAREVILNFANKNTTSLRNLTYILEGSYGSGKSTFIKDILSNLGAKYTRLVLNNNDIPALSTIADYSFLYPLCVVIEDLNEIQEKHLNQSLFHFINHLSSNRDCIFLMTTTDVRSFTRHLSENIHIARMDNDETHLRDTIRQTLSKYESEFDEEWIISQIEKPNIGKILQAIKKTILISDEAKLTKSNLEKINSVKKE